MTIRDLLKKIEKEKPNSFTEADIIAFVNEVEPEVAEQLKVTDIPAYTDDPGDLDDVLLAPSPYDRLYTSYVKAAIDFANDEMDSYANNQAQHVRDFQDFTDWVVRTGQVTETEYPHRFRHITRW